MFDELPTLKNLLKQLQQVPYLASKNLYRVAQYFLDMDEKKQEAFCRALEEAKKKLARCSTCYAWQERKASCIFCHNSQRDHSTICVVATWQDLYAIEQSGAYEGDYHVLGGIISPLDGIGPQDLTIEQLINRVSSTHKEVILALNQTAEGEATATFIIKRLASTGVSLSSLARGMPVGSSLEYTDKLTLLKSITERRNIT